MLWGCVRCACAGSCEPASSMAGVPNLVSRPCRRPGSFRSCVERLGGLAGRDFGAASRRV